MSGVGECVHVCAALAFPLDLGARPLCRRLRGRAPPEDPSPLRGTLGSSLRSLAEGVLLGEEQLSLGGEFQLVSELVR